MQNQGGATSSLPMRQRIVGSGDAASSMQEVLQTPLVFEDEGPEDCFEWIGWRFYYCQLAFHPRKRMNVHCDNFLTGLTAQSHSGSGYSRM